MVSAAMSRARRAEECPPTHAVGVHPSQAAAPLGTCKDERISWQNGLLARREKPVGITDFIRGQFIEIIEWTDDSRDTLSYRFPDEDKEIKRGAQLIVRESQVVQFVYLGQYGDLFGPGKHTLTTDNIPVLSRLKGWKYGFESPFKADVYYVDDAPVHRQQVGHVESGHGARSGLRHRPRARVRHLRLPHRRSRRGS